MKLKTLTVKELRTKKSADIEKYVIELEHSQIELNHLINTNKDKQTHQISLIKKAIARAKTIQTQAVNQEKEK